jgi:excisionase family DNA binding protein
MPKLTKRRTKPTGILMYPPEAAQLLDMSLFVLYKHVREGRIPHRRLGRSIRFSRPELEAWLRGSN